MRAEQAINCERLSAATRRLVAHEGFAPRIAWWLQGGHATERWVQFEWAFCLQPEVTPDFAVLCEHGGHIDVTLVPALEPTRPLRDEGPAAGVELKWYGNWWLNDRIASVNDDKLKVGMLRVPAAAVLLLLHVDVAQPARHHGWIPRGLPSWEEVYALLVSNVGEPHCHAEYVLNSCPPFSTASLHALVYYNDLGRGAL